MALAAVFGAVLTPAPGLTAQELAEVGEAPASRPITQPLAIPRLTGPVTLDGVVDEAAWAAVEPLPLVMHEPTFGGELGERTEIRIAHDDQYLYASGRMWDSSPEDIRTNTFYRDLYSGDDLMAVVIDSYNDFETAVWFVSNPAGARNDRSVSNDGVFGGGGSAMNSDWNSHWEVQTTQTSEGWFAEFRIPFSTLGFQAVQDRVTMGLIAYRFIPRLNERQTFPAIDPKWGGLAFAKPSQAQRVVMDNVRQSKPVYVTPYTLGGLRQTPELQGPDDARTWSTDSDPTTEAGVDLRYSPTSNLALDFTVNTDFAQVEADDQQINLTRFPLFFPEKRQFFQERSSTFQFSTGGSSNRLFHSRRIGLDDGEIVRIWGGGRAVGRLGGLDFGVLSMQTADHQGSPGENMGVLRLNQELFNPYSSVGAMLTTRLGGLVNNVAYGVDGTVRVFGDEYVLAKWAQTFDEALREESALESGLYFLRWERRTDDGLSYWAEHNRVGRDYRPGLGFQTRTGTRFFGGSLRYNRFTSADSPLRSVYVQVSNGHYLRTDDGTAESRSISPEVRVEYKGGTEVRLSGNVNYESVLAPFTVAGAEIPSGEYWFAEGELRLQLPRSDLLRGDYSVTAGRFYDGRRLGLALNPTWNQSKYLELQGGYQINRLDFDSRGQDATAHLASLKVQVALDTRISFSTLAQYSNVADLTSVNARFRYHFREGTDLWVVYNEGLNMDRTGDLDFLDPRRPLSAGRTLMVKYTHALIW